MLYGVVYKLTSPSLKVYIGQTVDFDHRMRQYSFGSCKLQRYLYAAIVKYGWDNFNKEVLAPAYSRAELDRLEIDFIRDYKATNPAYGYNIIAGGGGSTGLRHSDGAKEKIAAAMRGRETSPETRAKMSKNMLGKKMSPESIEKMAATKRGKKQAPEWAEKAAAARRGLKRSPEATAKTSAANRGRKHTPEAIEKMAAVKRGKKPSGETKARMSAAHLVSWRRRRALGRGSERGGSPV